MYQYKSRIRYSEIEKERKLTISSIIDYFQNCSTFQSEDLHVGLEYLHEHNRAWLIYSWQIVFERYPDYCENITVGTWAYDFNPLYGFRNFLMTDEKGNTVAYANSVWFYADTHYMKPAKIQETDINMYPIEEKQPMDYANRKIKFPNDLDQKDSIKIIPYHIDTNNHVNNGQYIKMAEPYLPEHFKVEQLRVEYKTAALLGDTVVIKTKETDEYFYVVLCNSEDKPYTVIEYKRAGGKNE